ncbi:hypothetical protein AOCH_000601 [Aspergillus ochraceoroseus]|uniref:ABC a-pheromone efflux pump AtrD n=1 Tax=Aspergillus ochraceoroseus TaxID=138278 RepID=A0A0F8WNN0_9EURO|nr:hypothetical protein AOCH_000601 [Aspergillus ochraceoroseus]
MSKPFDPETAENLEDMERQFAVKAVEHLMTYWSILEKVRGSELRLTKMDDEIYEHFKKEFPEFDPAETIDEDNMKSKEGKEKWRNWVNQYEDKIHDFNFGTMLRASAKTEYDRDNTIFAALLASFVTPIFSVILGEIFNCFTQYGGGAITGDVLIERVSAYCLRLVGLGAIGWLCNSIYFILFVAFGELQAANSRDRLFGELLKKDQRWFEAREEGTADGDFAPFGTCVAIFLSNHYLLGLSFYTSWKLSLVILAGIPIVLAIVPFLSPKIEANIEAQKEELTKASKIVNIAVASIDTVKCLNGQSIELRNYVSRIDKATTKYLIQACFSSVQISIIRFMMFGMFVQGFWYGSTLVHSGNLLAGNVLRTFWACSTAAQSVEALLPQVIVLQKGKVAASALQKILDDRTDDAPTREMQGALYPSHCEGDIEVTNLSFCYPSQPNRLSLNSASFFFPAGATTFIIGKSGSGKSTLGQLLTGFYLPTSGEILIDGNPIQTLRVNWIRNNVTYVEQRSILFNESILKNIAFGRRDYEDIQKADVEESISLAMLKGTIESLPNGIDTCVGDGGSFLSGGQRQRVAIARARLRDTPILIMDEPTSALDGTNRVEVINALREWRKNKTTIIITHDMSHIRDCDFVYVLDHGSVLQSGYKHELKYTQKCGEFFDSHQKTHFTRDEFRKHFGEDDDLLSDSDASSTCSTENSYDQNKDKLSRTHHTTPPLPPPKAYPGRVQAKAMAEQFTSSLEYDGWRGRGEVYPPNVPFVNQFEIPMEDLDHTQGKRSHMKTRRLENQTSPAVYPSRQVRDSDHKKVTSSWRKRRMNAHLKHTQSPLRRALQTVLPSLTLKQRLYLLVATFCTLTHASATPMFSFFLSQLLRTFYSEHDDGMKWALAVLGVSVFDAFATYSMHYLLELCGQIWIDNLRKRAFERVLDQPREWFEEEQNSPSQISTCLYESGEEVRNILSRLGGFVLVAASVTLMAVIWSLAICWKLTFVALACGPVIYAITRGFERTSGIWDQRCTEARTTISNVFVETFCEIRTVRSLTLEHYFHRKYLKAASKCLTVGFRKAIYTGLLFGLVESTISFVSALIFYYGAALVKYQEFTVGNIMTVFSVLLFSISYASTVVSWIPQISSSREMAKRLLRLVDLPKGASHEHLGQTKISRAGAVKIARLNFEYPSRPNAPVLRDVSLSIPTGSCTAIVGRSGSGKSTIASLLLNLYETPRSRYPPDTFSPTISFGGIDIHQLHTPTLRSLIAVVAQQPTIFPGTIQDNISYGLPSDSHLNTLHSVRGAAKAAGIDEFIMSLPDGYLTVIGDGGVGFSGGQAQRLVIARALVRRPQILILDEATSSLDPKGADLIKETVRGLVSTRQGLTVIIITHARKMMELADKVIVLDQGRIVEEGPYRALSRKHGGKLRALIEHPTEET